jgi:predicted nucleotidyltransferase
MNNHRRNIDRIKAVSRAFGKLKEDIVFVGGATVSLYADRMAEEVRETIDIDIVVEIYSRIDFLKLENDLRQLGFSPNTEARFIGSYKFDNLIVDVMPISEAILGFSNKWYREGYDFAITYPIDKENTVKIFSPPYFLASKIEAFKSRGKNANNQYDGRTSSDFEDIVFVLENRFAIWDEFKSSPPSVKDYLKKEFTSLLAVPYIEEWIDAHVAYNLPYEETATGFIIQKLRDFTNQQ